MDWLRGSTKRRYVTAHQKPKTGRQMVMMITLVIIAYALTRVAH